MLKMKFCFLVVMVTLLFTLIAGCTYIEHDKSEINKSTTHKIAQAQGKNAHPLLLISIDGLRHDYFEKTELPNLTRLAKQGLWADSLQHVFPTKTFVTHYSMVTGLYAENTGVVSNTMWDADTRTMFTLRDRDAVMDKKWYDGEPIWNTLEKNGKQAATYAWPGSEAPVGDMRPTIWMPFDGDLSHNARVKQIFEWLDLPGEERPEFLTLYFSVVDSAGHRYGPDHPKVISALQEVDRALGLLIEGIEARGLLKKMHILVTSDHGMEPIDIDRYVFLDAFIDVNKVNISDWSPVAHIWATDDGLTVDEIYEALHDAHPHMQVWKKADVPARYHFNDHKRIADVIAEVDLGWMMSTKSFYDRIKRGVLSGMHGWDPAWHSMHGVFIAHGPAFTAGTRIPAVRSIDLYSLMAKLMQIEPSINDGSLNAFAPILFSSQPASVSSSNWTCDTTTLVLREGLGHASVEHNGKVFSLPLQASASGRKYEDTSVVFWSKGNEAQVAIDGKSFTNCRITDPLL